MMKIRFTILLLFFSLSAQAQISNPSPVQNDSIPTSALPDKGEDRSRISGHVYHVSAWGSIGLTAAGAAASIATYSFINNKPDITNQEFDVLQSQESRKSMNAFDRWALNLKMPTVDYTWPALGMQTLCAALPLTLFFGDRFKKDWDDIILMLLETNAMAVTIYEVSPFGPFFQNKYRPLVYAAGTDPIARDSLKTGRNRNSFFSGHVGSAVASMYFMAKVYCDYHPEIQGWDKIGIYALASVPPLALGYLRLVALKHFPSDILVGFIIGGVCGITIPEIHRIAGKNISFGAYSSPTSTGMTMTLGLK